MLRDLVSVTVLVLIVSLGSSSPSMEDDNGLKGPMEMDNFLEKEKEEEGGNKFPKFLKVQVFPASRLAHHHHQHQSRDLEVVLNSGPLLSPDVLFNTLLIQDTPGEVSPTEPARPPPSSSSSSGNDGGDPGTLVLGRGFTGFPQWPTVPDEDSVLDGLFSGSDNSVGGELEDDGGRSRSREEPPDITKINATSGGFRFNFSEDAKFLVVSPDLGSRLVLTCDPVDLGNCSSSTDTLVVNNVGDLRFGRNSFIYCGAQAKVRVVSLRRKISIRIRRDSRTLGMECKFFSRKQRFLEGDESSCGKLGEGRNAKIIGGRQIAPGLFPYLAQLDLTKSSGVHTTCSGSLVSDSWILTAAAEKFILHKNWNSKTLLGDIALVKLSKRIKFTDEISPVCLPDKKLRNENLSGKTGVATGWGRVATTERAPRKAFRVRLPFLSDLRCFLSYPRYFRPKVMMCTESTEEKAICYGDSGGPLLFLRNQRVYQVGISSYSSSQVCGESFDVFTRLDDNYVEWINKRIEE